MLHKHIALVVKPSLLVGLACLCTKNCMNMYALLHKKTAKDVLKNKEMWTEQIALLTV